MYLFFQKTNTEEYAEVQQRERDDQYGQDLGCQTLKYVETIKFGIHGVISLISGNTTGKTREDPEWIFRERILLRFVQQGTF